jgi:hypothetical protein
MLAQMNKQDKCVYVEKTNVCRTHPHTSAGELYRRKEKENRTEIVHCLCQDAAAKKGKGKKTRQCFADQKNRQNSIIVVQESSRYIHIKEEYFLMRIERNKTFITVTATTTQTCIPETLVGSGG